MITRRNQKEKKRTWEDSPETKSSVQKPKGGKKRSIHRARKPNGKSGAMKHASLGGEQKA